ncbi:MAG: hypothetical protein ACTSRZ_21360 [Promethearchaeota archaeon]
MKNKYLNLNDKLSTTEFAYYLSPRYFRLIFPQFKPKTKNGDLVSALNELKMAKILTYDSDWDNIHLTKKGTQYKKLIKKLIDMNLLYTVDSNGLFDYRSDLGRKSIIELIGFLASKLNFTQYFNYLSLPVFEAEYDKEWLDIFKDDKEDIADLNSNSISSEKFQQLQSFLNKKKVLFQRNSQSINKKISKYNKPLSLDIYIIRNFLKNLGLNRPSPLFNHFNSMPQPRIFFYDKRNFYVNVNELIKIKNTLKENLADFSDDQNKWLVDYFKILKLPIDVYGIQKSSYIFESKEIDAFLRLAIEGPKILAKQFSSVNHIGDLIMIAFPISEENSFVIYVHESNLLFYFTIKTKNIYFNQTIDFISSKNFPRTYRTSRKRFGKLLERSYTIEEVTLRQRIESIEDKEQKKKFEEELKSKKQQLRQQIEGYSKISASLFTICQAIAYKLSNNFYINKVICLFKNGCIFLHYIDSDTILTLINIGKIEYGSEFKNIIKKINESFNEILKEEITI